jgi:hypothetical protein
VCRRALARFTSKFATARQSPARAHFSVVQCVRPMPESYSSLLDGYGGYANFSLAPQGSPALGVRFVHAHRRASRLYAAQHCESDRIRIEIACLIDSSQRMASVSVSLKPLDTGSHQRRSGAILAGGGCFRSLFCSCPPGTCPPTSNSLIRSAIMRSTPPTVVWMARQGYVRLFGYDSSASET